MGQGVANPTSFLSLSNIFYAPNFPINFLSTSMITSALFCSINLFPYYCTFQDWRTGERIGLGQETGHGLYEHVTETRPIRLFCLLSQNNISLQWHQQLQHPNIIKRYYMISLSANEDHADCRPRCSRCMSRRVETEITS